MRKIFKFFFLFLFVIFITGLMSVRGSEIEGLFQNANSAYDQGDYQKAIQLYQRIIQSGVKTSKVYYNLGNACFRNENRGLAILYYLKALKLHPRDEDTNTNLSFVKLFTVDKIENEKNFFLSKVFSSIRSLATLDEWTFLTSGFYFLGMIFLILFVLTRKLKRLHLTLFSVFITLFLLTSIFLGSKIYSETVVKRGVVVASESEVRSGPGDDYTLQFKVHEGLEFKIKDKKNNWLVIYLPNGARGWLKSGDVGIV